MKRRKGGSLEGTNKEPAGFNHTNRYEKSKRKGASRRRTTRCDAPANAPSDGTNLTNRTDGYTSRPGAYTNAKYFRWSMPELPSCPNLTLTLPSCPALAAQSTSLGWHRAPWAHRLRHPG